MYPHRELIRFAAHKATLRCEIAIRRVECAEALTRIVRPLRWLDRMLVFWRQLPPLLRFAAVPVALLVKKSSGFPRLNILRRLVRWSPLVFGIVRTVTSVTRAGGKSVPNTS